jgi:hypothetical protein
MERIEPVYRYQSAVPESPTAGCLADPVSGRPERNCHDITNRHCETFRTSAADGQHDNRRTRTAETDSDIAPGRTESGNVPVSGSEHHSAGLNVSAFADINVSANDRFNGQQLLTYPRRDPEEGSLNFGSAVTPFSLPYPELNAPTPAGGRSESQRRNAGFNVSASGGG